jgi:hypothetical protein
MAFKTVSTGKQKYLFNKWIFRGCIIIMILLALSAWFLTGFINPLKQNLEIVCKTDNTPCTNPLYNNFDICGEGKMLPSYHYLCITELLPPGYHYGSEPNFLLNHFLEITIILILLAFLLNHMIFNKGFKDLGGFVK